MRVAVHSAKAYDRESLDLVNAQVGLEPHLALPLHRARLRAGPERARARARHRVRPARAHLGRERRRHPQLPAHAGDAPPRARRDRRPAEAGRDARNTGRGALLDTAAAIDGLESGRIGALALDVYEEEAELFFEDRSDEVIDDDVFARLLTFPNVLITAHQAFFTAEALAAIAESTLGSLAALAAGERPPTLIAG